MERGRKLRPAVRRLTLTVVAGIVVSFIGVGIGGVAFAFIAGGHDTCPADDFIPFRFDPAEGFTADEMDAVDFFGAHDWELLYDSNGPRLVSSRPQSNNAQALVTVRQFWPTLGRTYCIFHAYRIELDETLRDGEFNDHMLDEVAAHEFGHAHGLTHTGKHDSKDGDNPSVMSCAVPDKRKRVSQDDASALVQLHNPEVGGMYTITANPSFERGSKAYWGSNGYSAVSGTASDGSYYAKMPVYGSSLYQTTRLTDGGMVTDVDARINMRRLSANSGGRVQVLLQAGGPITYAPGGTCSVPWFLANTNINKPSDTGTALILTRLKTNCYPKVEWRTCTTFDWTMPAAWSAGDLRIWVNNLRTGASAIEVDNMRLRGNSWFPA